MAEKIKYTIDGIYQGGTSAFKPTPNSRYFTVGQLGLTTDPRTANVLKEVSDKLSAGVKQIEIEAVSADFFDKVAKQQLEETRRLSKLTGVDISVHGPVIDTTGIDQRSGYSESNRILAEKKIIATLERSHELDPTGNIPVNFHSAEGLPGSEFGPKRTKEGERDYQKIIAVDKETGRLTPLEKEEKYYPIQPGREHKEGGVKTVPYTPMQNLEIANETTWDNTITPILLQKERFDDILTKNEPLIRPVMEYINKDPKNFNANNLPPTQQEVYRKIMDAQTYLGEMHKQANSAFSKAYEYGDKDQKEALVKLSKNLYKDLENDSTIFGQSRAMHNFLLGLKGDPQELKKVGINLYDEEKERFSFAPKMYVPIEEFALTQSSKTYGNAAFEAFKKYGDNSPMTVIENPPAGFALSTGEDLKNLVEGTRKQFVERAVKEKGLSEDEAKRAAEKLIGATLDVGHMNMLKKYGYSDADIVAESAKLAPMLKHLHLSDNFGGEHTELPMGMGNVPLNKIMAKLEKSGVKNDEIRKIIEASVWWTDFRTSPVYASLDLLGPGMYQGGRGPYWNQAPGLSQDYFGGYGMMLPSVNYETFGAGFSRLPAELGGSTQGAQGGRMSGRGME